MVLHVHLLVLVFTFRPILPSEPPLNWTMVPRKILVNYSATYLYTIWIERCIVDRPYHCQHSPLRALVVLHDRGLVPAVLFRSDPLRSDRIYAYPWKSRGKRLDRRIFFLRCAPLSRSSCGQASQISNGLIACKRKESRLCSRSLVHVASVCSWFSPYPS
jgi:hypothetical protein